MANITFSVDDNLHRKMKEHPEIKWTEILRRAIIDYLRKIEEIDIISMKDFRNKFEPDILRILDELDEKKEIEFTEKVKKLDDERFQKIIELEKSD
ncbi:MAG: hypothetical protein ACTSVV_06215 [Promethearchaeota archaeon]